MAKAFSAPVALLCLAQVPGHPLDLERGLGATAGCPVPIEGHWWGIWWLYGAWGRDVAIV